MPDKCEHKNRYENATELEFDSWGDILDERFRSTYAIYRCLERCCDCEALVVKRYVIDAVPEYS